MASCSELRAMTSTPREAESRGGDGEPLALGRSELLEHRGDDRGCGESREMELLWPYAFPHEAPEKASPEELGVPQWYAITAPQVKAEEPPTAVRSRSWARAEGRKGRRVSHTQMGHVRTARHREYLKKHL